MKLEDRLRAELTRQSNQTHIRGAGALAVATTATGRTRRTRIVGATAVAGLFALGAGLAVTNSDSNSVTNLATDTSTEAAGSAGAVDAPAEPVVSDQGADTARTLDDDPSPESRNAQASAVPAELAVADSLDGSAVGPAEVGLVTDLVPFKDGFVALSAGGTDQAVLWFSTDGESWSQIGEPLGGKQASITYITSYDGTLHVAGSQPAGQVGSPWMAASTDLEAWESLDLPETEGSTSDLIDIYFRLTSIASGPAGLIVTGDTNSDLVLGSLLNATTIANNAWSLGDSSGDLSRLIVYNDAGDQIDEIDLVAAGVPEAIIDAWTNGESTPWLAVAADGRTLEIIDPAVGGQPALSDAAVTPTGFAARGFSDQLSEQVVWESADGLAWTPVSITAVTHERADTIGSIGDRLVVVTATGPLLTVQRGDNGQWTETRLDELFGDGSDDADYQLVDLAFDAAGAIGVVQTVSGSENPELWVIRTNDATSWSAEPLVDFVGDDVASVGAVSISASSVALAYQTEAGDYQVAVTDR